MKLNMPIISGVMWWTFVFTAGNQQALVENKYFSGKGELSAAKVYGCEVGKLAHGKGYAFAQLATGCVVETKVIFRYDPKAKGEGK